MRMLPILWLMLLACAGFGAQNYDATAVNADMAPTISLTTTEDTVTVLVQNNGARYVQFQCSTDWGIANATSTFANKTFIPANTPYTVMIPSDAPTTGVVFYIQASTTTGVLKGRTLARTK